MERPNPEQIRAAVAIFKQFYVNTRGTASDTLMESVIYSIAAVLGAPGQPSAEYADAIKEATMGEINVRPVLDFDYTARTFTVLRENPLGLKVGAVFNYQEDGGDAVDATESDDTSADPAVEAGDTSGETSELPTAAALQKMNKDDLVEAINAEVGGDPIVTEDYGTKADLINALAEFRAGGVWPVYYNKG